MAIADLIDVARLLKRYKHEYTVAKVMVGLGTLIKVIGFFFAIVGALSAMDIASMPWSPLAAPTAPLAAATATVLFGVLVFAAFYVTGVLVSAPGHILRATLDTAVNSCPFLDNEQRAEIMSLY